MEVAAAFAIVLACSTSISPGSVIFLSFTSNSVFGIPLLKRHKMGDACCLCSLSRALHSDMTVLDAQDGTAETLCQVDHARPLPGSNIQHALVRFQMQCSPEIRGECRSPWME